MSTIGIVGEDAIRRDGARTLLYDHFGTTHTLPSIGAFLDLAFGGAERTTFGEFLTRLHRYYLGTGCRPLTRTARPMRPDAGGDGPDRGRGPIHGGLGVVGGDALGRDGVRAILLGAGRGGWGAATAADVDAFLDLAFGEVLIGEEREERITFNELLAQLYRYYRHVGCSLVRTERLGGGCELLPIPAGADWLPNAEQMYAMLASAHGGAANFPETCNVKAGLRNIEALIRQHAVGPRPTGLVALWRHANPPTDEDPGGSEDVLVWNPDGRGGEPRAGCVLRRRGTFGRPCGAAPAYETVLCDNIPAKLCALLAQEWGSKPYDGKRNGASPGLENGDAP